MKKLTLLLCAVVIMGCAPSVKLSKPGMTQEQWEWDSSECHTEASLALDWDKGYRTAMANAIASDSEYNRFFESCCEAKGYRKFSVDEYERMLAK
jgi:hypothetical protein